MPSDTAGRQSPGVMPKKTFLENTLNSMTGISLGIMITFIRSAGNSQQ